MQKKTFILLIILLAIPFTLMAKPAGMPCPVKQVKHIVDNAVSVFDETDHGLSQLKNLYETSCQFFDKKRIARSVLGKRWNGKGNIQGFNPGQQKEFQENFLYMLFVIWYNKIDQEQERQNGEIIVLYKNKAIYRKTKSGRDLAIVKTRIKRNNVMIPVDYFLIYKNGCWLIYDIAVESVKIAQNYRKQLQKYLKKDPPYIISKIKKKISKLEAKI